jgi:hypothetical protein
MCKFRTALAALALITLVACGSDGDSNPPPPPPTPAPSGLSYPTQQPYTVNVAVANVTPTVTGSVTSYAVSPALPTGLSVNTTSGVLSGTPTQIAGPASYTVTATNSSGSTTATLTLSVRDVPPDISYPQATYTMSTGVPIQPIVPTATGGAVTSWSISPAAPAGIAFNTANGQLTGTPTTASAGTQYVVTAQNSGGSDTFNLSFTVSSAVLLDLGHRGLVTVAFMSGNRAVTSDLSDGNVVFWNAQTGAILLKCGDQAPYCGGPIGLAGNTLALATSNEIVIRDPSDASVVATIPARSNTTAFWYKLASDGSYVVAGNSEGLWVWSRTGTPQAMRTGNFDHAKVFAAPGQLRIYNGGNAIDYIALPGSIISTGPAFQGSFEGWFVDGSHYITRFGNMLWIHSAAGVVEDSGTVDTSGSPFPRFGGSGNWLWATRQGNSVLDFHAIGSGFATPVSFPGAGFPNFGSGTTFAHIPRTNRLSVYDLSGATPVKADYVAPVDHLSVFAANSPADWIFGNEEGVVMGELNAGSPLVYAPGDAFSIAGGTNHVAVATASGNIYYFNPNTHAVEGAIPSRRWRLQANLDGSRLGAEGDSQDQTLRVYDLPSENVIAERPVVGQAVPQPDAFSLSTSGTTLGRAFINFQGNGIGTRREVSLLDGTVIWSEPVVNAIPLRLSPTGGLFAKVDGTGWADTTTTIFTGNTATASTLGGVVGWIDDSRLLVKRYVDDHGLRLYFQSVVVNAGGSVLHTLAQFPELKEIQPVSGNSVYSPEANWIFDVTTGATIWNSVSPHNGEGVVAGSQVVFSSGATVRIEPR